jgi:hypothetical protein
VALAGLVAAVPAGLLQLLDHLLHRFFAVLRVFFVGIAVLLYRLDLGVVHDLGQFNFRQTFVRLARLFGRRVPPDLDDSVFLQKCIVEPRRADSVAVVPLHEQIVQIVGALLGLLFVALLRSFKFNDLIATDELRHELRHH